MQRPDAIDLARRAERVAVISGAGISSESGIPTFRGAGGLWRNYRAEDLATPGAFARDPQTVWEWYDWRRGICKAAEPNAAHRVVAEMEAHYPEFLVATQNVDGLHRRAGSENIEEIHGSIFRGRCVQCGVKAELWETPLPELPPLCGECGSPVRPDIVWFGESYDQRQLGRVLDFLGRAELVFVIGTSGMVPIPLYLAQAAAERGARVVDVNPERGAATDVSDCFLQGKAGEVLPAFWKEVRSA